MQREWARGDIGGSAYYNNGGSPVVINGGSPVVITNNSATAEARLFAKKLGNVESAMSKIYLEKGKEILYDNSCRL